MHAVVVAVKIDPEQSDASRTVLKNEVVPRVSQAPGFSSGYWTAADDQTNGLSMVLFDTKDNAQAAANMVSTMPLAPGVTIDSVEVREVVAQA
jgi:hypothetical protein